MLLLTCSIGLSAQESISYQTKLVSTAKIWGFLKYYHPHVAKGAYDWDKKLIDLFPKLETANTKEELSNVYLDWINKLGEVIPCKSCSKRSKHEYFNKNFDLTWLSNNELFTKKLSNTLVYIENNRLLKNHHYVKYGPVGEANPINENLYEDIGFPNDNYKLLGLFRYWNFIEYFYPNKYLTDQSWDDVLQEMIPKLLKTKNEDDYFLILRELFAKLDDSHTFLTRKSNVPINVFPYKIKNIDNKCVVSGNYSQNIAKKEGLLMGDVILKVNNNDIKKETKKILKYLSGSNLNGKVIYAYKNILSSENRSLDLMILRNEDTINKTVNLYAYKALYSSLKELPKWKLLDNNIGYVDVKLLWNKEDVYQAITSLKSTKGIILDVRGYPTMSSLKIPEFLNLERKPFAKLVLPDLSYPGKFLWKREKITTGKKNKDFYKGQVIILADDQSLSLSEYVIMSLQTVDNSITIGSQTLGADGRNLIFNYLGGYKTSMTSQGVFYPDKTQTQRNGVKIDLEVKPTIKGLSKGRDEVIEKAIEIIKKN
jgi:C-terminal processing protease CtpA/Prc